MKLIIDGRVKSIAVQVGPFTVFGQDKNTLDPNARAQRFDEVWDAGLRQAVEDSIKKRNIVSVDVVIERMRANRQTNHGESKAERYVNPKLTHFECTYHALCVAQVEQLDDENYAIDQLWFFTYTNKQPLRVCFEFDDQSQANEFHDLSKKLGMGAPALAKQVVLQAMNDHIMALQIRKEALAAEVGRLEEQARKSNIAFFTASLEELRKRLKTPFPETEGPTSWQTWIHQNAWLFGSRYGDPISKQKVGFSSIPDFIFPTFDGFLDILEIKLPSMRLLVKDSSHTDSFAWASELSHAIGQVVTYIHEVDMHQLEIVDKLKKRGTNLSAIRPRAFILAGRSDSWGDDERQAVRRLNYALHGIEVLTYDDLIERGEHLLSLYTRKLA